MSEYVTLKSLTSKIGSGATPRGGSQVYQDSGVSFIRSQNVQDMYFSNAGLVFLSNEQAEHLKGVTVKNSDILLNITGDSIARSCLVPNKILPARVNQHVSIIRCKDSKDANFIAYYLQFLKPYLLQVCRVGGTRNALTKDVIENLKISFLEDRHSRGSLLALIDKKIELNNRINAELEAMAKTLYDYWFVQFDFPDANGKPYKTSGGKIVYNPILKREIPEGWSITSLVDIAEFTNGIACQKYYPCDDEYTYKVIKIREFGSGFDDKSETVTQLVPKKIIVNDGDVLFSWSATLDVIIWTGGIGALNQHIFKVTSNGYPRTFYYFEILRYLEYFKMVANLRKTTMGHITKAHLVDSRISLPPANLIKEMDAKIAPIFEKTLNNSKENQELAKLRDWLLPMLMNGQVTVK